MPRKQKKYHYIYKTTCLVTSRFYIGMHSTHNLNDGYKGSGTILWHSINKYGKEKHVVEIIEYLNNRNLLKEREKQIVNEEIIQDASCMNLQLGGGGGFNSKAHQIKCSLAGAKKIKELLCNDATFIKKWGERSAKNLKNTWDKGLLNKSGINNGFYNEKHKEETKKKISLTQQVKQKGNKNSQFGTQWITNGKQNKKIKKGDLIPNKWKLGRSLKTLK